jgi:hypothetical protein
MDRVNKPTHYQGTIEAIDAIEASMPLQQQMGYLKGNVMKYIIRWDRKNGLEDLKKAQWYLNRMIDKQEKHENQKRTI